MKKICLLIVCGLLALAFAWRAEAADFFELCGTGTVKEVEDAIKAGADVNARYSNGWTPLMSAARHNSNPEVITTLIKNRADVNAIGPDGWTPLMFVARENSNPEVISTLIKAGADVNAIGPDGWTPLMFAAMENSNPEVISTLIKAGADVNARDSNGGTPLMFAAAYNSNPEVISTLIKNGADVNARDSNGLTPLMLAKSNPNPGVATVLRQARADDNISFRLLLYLRIPYTGIDDFLKGYLAIAILSGPLVFAFLLLFIPLVMFFRFFWGLALKYDAAKSTGGGDIIINTMSRIIFAILTVIVLTTLPAVVITFFLSLMFGISVFTVYGGLCLYVVLVRRIPMKARMALSDTGADLSGEAATEIQAKRILTRDRY
ncbi:MAG: ankyrin repeat domain-containing protein [Synergistaceae bacterium]|nr:ankyrin repeat domain-containing protein [Synergistaceae bacterium]